MNFNRVLSGKHVIPTSRGMMVNLLDKTFEIPDDFEAQVYDVSPDYTGRLDLLVEDTYGDTIYTDIIAKLNGISNIYEVNEGDTIVLPLMKELDRFIVRPAEEWTEAGWTKKAGETIPITQKKRPKAKKRSEKRRPNEAVVGDKRFNIDPISKTVIY